MKTILISILFFTALTARAALITSAPDKGSVHFEATGRPAMVKIKGHGEGPVGKLNLEGKKLNGELTFKMETLNTGIGMRDEHMKEKYLEVAKFPTAVLKIKDMVLPDAWTPQTAGLKDQAFKGTLTLHGVEKEVSGIVNVNNDMGANADFEIKISEFGISIPSYLGITVADTVRVRVNVAEFKVQEAKP